MGIVEDKIAHVVRAVELEGEKTRLEMAAGLAESMRGARIDGALPRPITGTAQAYGAGGRLVGWSVRANGGDVVLDLYDGQDADPLRYLGAVDIPSGSQTVWMGPGGVSFVDGLYVAASGAGTPLGALWIGAVD